ncbi:MAG: hypothetical protein OEY38_24245 [Gammaproteobacteria bacterium]|nr:hypothetical protein [Gammaproteobacteria bacterium]
MQQTCKKTLHKLLYINLLIFLCGTSISYDDYLSPSKAITATAHKLAIIFYIMLRDKVDFIELGVDYYERQYQERMKRNLKRKAKSLGLKLIPIDEKETPAEPKPESKATKVSSS